MSHNKNHPIEYHAWQGMIKRCKRNPCYVGRGIKVCSEWKDQFNGFQAFYDHIGPKPFPEFVLDRKDNNGNYEPGNVRWTTPSESSKNKRGIRLITYDGKTMCLTDWANKFDINSSIIRHRLDKWNWSIKEALTKKVYK